MPLIRLLPSRAGNITTITQSGITTTTTTQTYDAQKRVIEDDYLAIQTAPSAAL
jgi:hypothetical protein